MALVAAYSFDDSVVSDMTGRGHTGTLFNTPTFPAGHTGLGIEFDSASSEYAVIDDHADFTFGSAWTIMCWVKPTTTTAAMSLVTKQNQWWFGINSNNTVTTGFYKIGGGTEGIAATTGVVVDGTWVHLAMRYDGNEIEICFDGVEDATHSTVGLFTMIDTTNPVRLGTWDAATEFLDAVLDDVRIFNEYLDDAAVTSYMNLPVTAKKGHVRLAGPQILPVAPEPLYTAPSGTRVEIRNVALSNPGSDAVIVMLAVGDDAAGTRVMERPLAAGETYETRRPLNHTLLGSTPDFLEGCATPFPMSGTLDDFNRADENPLSGGGNWTTAFSNNALKIVSNAVTSTIDGGANNDMALYTATVFSDDQYAQAKLNVVSINGVRRGPGLSLRYATGANTGYRFSTDHASSNNVNISRVLAGVRTTLLEFTKAWTDGDTWTFMVSGPATAALLRLFLNGDLVGQVTDNSSIASGYPGIFFGDNIDVTSWSADDFMAGTAPANTTITVNGYVRAL